MRISCPDVTCEKPKAAYDIRKEAWSALSRVGIFGVVFLLPPQGSATSTSAEPQSVFSTSSRMCSVLLISELQ